MNGHASKERREIEGRTNWGGKGGRGAKRMYVGEDRKSWP